MKASTLKTLVSLQSRSNRRSTPNTITPTSATCYCYANIILPNSTRPTLVRSLRSFFFFSVPKSRAGSVTCEGDVTYTWTYTRFAEGNTNGIIIHTVTVISFHGPSFAAIPLSLTTTVIKSLAANIVLPTPSAILDKFAELRSHSNWPCSETGPEVTREEPHRLYLDLHRLRRRQPQDYVHTVTIEYAPFAAMIPSNDCYNGLLILANIILPQHHRR